MRFDSAPLMEVLGIHRIPPAMSKSVCVDNPKGPEKQVLRIFLFCLEHTLYTGEFDKNPTLDSLFENTSFPPAVSKL
jgi:hypothetical protein